MMRYLLLCQLVIGAVGSALVWFFSAGQVATLSFAFGALVSLFDLSVLVYAWPLLLRKKQVARPIATIVFKFAILVWILYVVAHTQTFALGWFACGLGTVVLSVSATAVKLAGNKTPNAKA